MSSTSHHGGLTPLERTLQLIRAERPDLIAATIYSIAVGGLSLTLPVAIQALVNTVAFGSVLQPVLVLTLLVTTALLGSAALHVMRTKVLETVQRRIFVRHTSSVLDRLLRVRTDALDPQHAPELVNRFLDVVTVQKSASVLVVDGLAVVMQTIIGLSLLAAYHPYLLLFDIVLVAAILTVLFGLGRGAVHTSIAESRAKYEVLAWLEEVARHTLTFRSDSGSRMAIERTDLLVKAYLQSRNGHFRIWLRQIIGSQALQAIAISSLLGIGGYLVIGGELTLGQLVAAELVVSLAVSSFAKFGKSLETFYDLQAALDKLGHLTDLPTERVGGQRIGVNPLPAAVRVHGLRFGYEANVPILRDIHLQVARGGRMALHGRSAAGKSTLLDLLYGLRDPDAGQMEFDGFDYRHLSLDALRKQIMLIRGPEVFPGTVFENVAMGLAVTEEEVRSALEQSGAWSAVANLPQGLDMNLSSSGRPLSPSQALRLTMARAIIHRPRLLLIDEALDAIDDLRIGGALVRTLFAADAPWTLLIATERSELWPLCDRVCVLENGTIQEEAATLSSQQGGSFA